MKKLLAILLVAAMLLPCLPVMALADDADYVEDPEEAGWDMKIILDAFAKKSYRTAYAALQEEAVAKGDKGDVVKTVQQVLKSFDVSVPTDGKMGSSTIEALNKVQKKFGLEKTDRVGAEEFAKLLVCLLIYNKGTGAKSTLLDAGVEWEEYQFYLGCYRYLNKHYYRAKCSFEESGLYDSAKRAKKCVQDWPKDGRIWKSSSIGSGTKLTVEVVNSESDEAHVFKIYTSDKKLVAVLFIGGNGKASTSLKPGKYIIKIGDGEEWYGRKDTFGSDGRYCTFKYNGSKKVQFKSYHEYTLTHGVYDGNGDSEYEDYEDF